MSGCRARWLPLRTSASITLIPTNPTNLLHTQKKDIQSFKEIQVRNEPYMLYVHIATKKSDSYELKMHYALLQELINN